MKAGLERRVSRLEEVRAARVKPEAMSKLEMARRIALILWRADPGRSRESSDKVIKPSPWDNLDRARRIAVILRRADPARTKEGG